ncbi:hypothetical protein MRX96_042450 [Rhipicephalus microplus]
MVRLLLAASEECAVVVGGGGRWKALARERGLSPALLRRRFSFRSARTTGVVRAALRPFGQWGCSKKAFWRRCLCGRTAGGLA